MTFPMRMLSGVGQLPSSPRFSLSSIIIATGIAYTIDPAYGAEVRDYLGESLRHPCSFLNLSRKTDYREKVVSSEPFAVLPSSIFGSVIPLIHLTYTLSTMEKSRS